MNFSVIIPCKGHAHLLGRAIASVCWQMKDGDELIVVMDEDIPKSVLEFAIDGEVMIRRSPGKGVSAARNHGLTLAKNEWIKFLDADDMAAPFSFDAMRRLKLPEHTQVVGGQQLTFADGLLNGQVAPNWNAIRNYNPCLLSNTFVRRAAAMDCGFDTRIEFEEDWDFWLKIRRRFSESAFGYFAAIFCFYCIDTEARKKIVRNHSVEGKDVRQYFKEKYGIDPK